MEAGLVEQSGGVQPLRRLVTVQAAGVGGEIDEAKQDGRRDDRGQCSEGEARRSGSWASPGIASVGLTGFSPELRLPGDGACARRGSTLRFRGR